MTLSSGTLLGPYEIVSPLGAGGMGEVYRARDIRLDRHVAIKILPSEVASDPERLRRFDQEARAASALNHPNILTIYDVGSADSISYIAMELIEGKTLRDILLKGPLPIKRLLDLAVQITEGLASAHGAGIVHRDLKPSNIVISKDGFAKILDFGLAKLPTPAPKLASGGSDSTTETVSETEPGVLVGTVDYMSPEQAAGKEADYRSDQFSLGSILYEMATGKRAFRRRTNLETLAAILNDEPQGLAHAHSATLPPLRWIIERCLSKHPEDRFSSTRDLARDLTDIERHSYEWDNIQTEPHNHVQLRWLRRPVGLVAVLALGILALGLTILTMRRSTSPTQVVRLQILCPPKTTFNLNSTAPAPVSFSPDGMRVVFGARDSTGKSQLWLRRLDELEARPMAGTEGAALPFWSPDSRSVGFFADEELKRVGIFGGPAQRLCNAPLGRGGSWGPNGTILFAPGGLGAIYRISESGGEPVRVSQPSANGPRPPHRWPLLLPDGRHFLYSAHGPLVSGRGQNIYLGSFENMTSKVVLDDASNMALSGRYLLFARGDLVMAARFDLRSLSIVGEAVPVLEGVFSHPYTRNVAFSASANGVIAYQPISGSDLSELVWVDRSGRFVDRLASSANYGGLRLSHDASKLAVEVRNQRSGDTDIWIYEVSRGIATRLTWGAAMSDSPVWSPDGTRIVFSSLRGSCWDLYETPVSLLQESHMEVLPGVNKAPSDWSWDGRSILFMTTETKSSRHELWSFGVPSRAVGPVLRSSFSYWGGQFSPDGAWLAYESDESGIAEVYACSLRNPMTKWQVSFGGGSQPRWRGDAKELFFINDQGDMIAAQIKTTIGFEVGKLDNLFRAGLRSTATDIGTYGVTADGKGFILNRVSVGGPPPSIVVFSNWAARLNSRSKD